MRRRSFLRGFVMALLLLASPAAGNSEELFCPPDMPIVMECSSCPNPGTYSGMGTKVETGLTEDTYIFEAIDQDGHTVYGSFKARTTDCIEAWFTPGPDAILLYDVKIWPIPAGD